MYLPKDSLGLTLNGTTKWTNAKDLRKLGETRLGATPAKVREILERIGDAISRTAKKLRLYIREHAEFAEIGERILQEWDKGSVISNRN